MSKAKQETIADIVAEMRNEGHAGDASCLEWVSKKYFMELWDGHAKCDRFEFKTKGATNG